MTSTHTSNILEVKNLSLSFRISHFRNDTLRDLFVKTLKDPFHFLGRNQDVNQVLRNINFEVKEGERVGILGVNGSGKTSLCKCLSSMLVPDTGEVNLRSDPLSIFGTTTGINPDLTGEENAYLLSVLLFPSMKEKERKALIQEACEFSELKDYLTVPFKFYSKGMQARLFLSLVSSKSSDLLILDEVFDGADIFFQKKVSDRIMNIILNSGAVIFVTHGIDTLQKVCNRAIIIHEGRIIFDGDVNKAAYKFQMLEKIATP